MADDAMARKHQREAPASERPGVHDPAVDEHTAKHLAYEVKTPKFSEFVSSQSEGAGMKAAERLAIVDQAWHPGSMAEARASSRPLSTGGCRSGGWWLSQWRMVAVAVADGGCRSGGWSRGSGEVGEGLAGFDEPGFARLDGLLGLTSLLVVAGRRGLVELSTQVRQRRLE